MTDRLKKAYEYLVYKKIIKKQEDLASILNLNRVTISNALKGNTKYLTESFINKFNDAFSSIFNTAWLLTGEGPMLKEEKPKYSELKSVDPTFVEVVKIPIKAKAGYLTGYNDETFLNEMPVVLVQVDQTFHGRYRCFEVEGDSMNDGTLKSICDGDTILCREVKSDLWSYKLHFNQWYFVINHIDGLLIKEIVDHDIEKGTITCHSLNPIYGEDFILNLNDVRELYNVIKITDRSLNR